MGILGAVLGLPKDRPQELLEPMQAALCGKIPSAHWHKAKLRKDPPEQLPRVVKRSQKQEKNTKPEKATLITQEWLFNPSYEVWVGLPEPYHTRLETRIKERKWYFQPSLGLSEMMADIEYLNHVEAQELPTGAYFVETVIKQDTVRLDIEKCYNEKLAINLLRMPRTVTADRVFSHAAYFMEKDARPIPLNTSEAYRGGERVLMFL